MSKTYEDLLALATLLVRNGLKALGSDTEQDYDLEKAKTMVILARLSLTERYKLSSLFTVLDEWNFQALKQSKRDGIHGQEN